MAEAPEAAVAKAAASVTQHKAPCWAGQGAAATSVDRARSLRLRGAGRSTQAEEAAAETLTEAATAVTEAAAAAAPAAGAATALRSVRTKALRLRPHHHLLLMCRNGAAQLRAAMKWMAAMDRSER